MKRRSLLLAAPLVLTVRGTPAFAATVKVASSFSILGDLARAVGGDAITQTVLVGAGVDAHTFQPTPADVLRLKNADLAFTVGLGFEAWWDRLSSAAGFRGRTVVTSRQVQPRHAGEDHDHDHGHSHRHDHEVADPHIWQDPTRARQMVAEIAAGLTAAGLNVEAAARRLSDEIATLEADIVRMLAPIPRAQRRIVTTHDAFGYFGERFGVDFIAAQGISTEAEPSAAQVAHLIRQIRDQHIRAVFIEASGGNRVLEQIAREAGVAVGGRLFSDTLDAPGTAAGTYTGMMRANATAIAAALRAPS